MLSAVLGNEDLDVVNQRRDYIGVLGSGDVCGGSPCGRRERRDRINQFLLESEQVGCRLQSRCSPSANRSCHLGTCVIVFERLKLPTGRILFGKDFIGCCVHFGEVRCFDIPLQHETCGACAPPNVKPLG